MRALFAVAGLLLVLACRPADSAAPGPPPDLVVAEYRLGAITVADLDRAILERAPDRRYGPVTDPDIQPTEWYAGVARRLAVDRLLVEEATLVGADREPQFRSRERRIERRATSDHYLAARPPPPPIGEEEIRAAFEADRDRYVRAERRLVYTLFRRFAGRREAEMAKVRSELEELRRRAVAGESFPLLAREHSDSETRHRDGLLGFVERGDYSDDFDRVVFALEERVPSEPVLTADGGHLFYVGTIHRERSFSLDEVRRGIRLELEEERRHRHLRESAAELPLPPGSFMPGPEEIAAIGAAGDPEALILRVGDFRLTVRELNEQLVHRLRWLAGRPAGDLPRRLLEEIRSREIIYQYLRDRGLPEIDRERLASERRRELVEYYGRRKMVASLENDPERIERYYDDNRLRFATPLRVELRRLSVPIGERPAAVMSRLEAARGELDRGELGLEALSRELGGELQELGWVTAGQLQAVDPAALRFVFVLRPGEHSPPYRAGDSLVLFQVAARREPEPRPFAVVRGRVIEELLTHHGPEIFEEVASSLLAAAEYRLYESRLAEVGRALLG